MTNFGYSGEILIIDLSSGKSTCCPVSTYAEKFIGGRGFAAKLYWDMVPAGAGALEPENLLTFVTGPASGFTGVAGNRWQVCGKSPQSQPEAFTYCNLGGLWGSTLKFAGYDALAITGKADRPVYLFIHDGQVEIRDASHLWGKYTFDTVDILKEELGEDIKALTIGPAGENMVVFATIYGEGGASGSSGLGSVMGSKNLKAIAVKGSKMPQAAHPEKLQILVDTIREIRHARTGGKTPPSPWGVPGITTSEDCEGCDFKCSRQTYPGDKNRRYKSFCQATDVYKKPVLDYYGEWNEAQLLAMRLCDAYSLDTDVMQALINWLIACYKEGALTEESTGLPLSKAGTAEFIEVLTRRISLREGFGDILARGTLSAAREIGGQAEALVSEFVHTRSSECKDYDPRLFITTALFYATEPRRAIHLLHGISGMVMSWLPFARGVKDAPVTSDTVRAQAARLWGSEIAADFSTYEGKALAGKLVQDRGYARECLILCDLAWIGAGGDPTLESRIYSAITGIDMSENGLLEVGERVFNLQRAIQLRLGWGGRRGDQLLPHLYTSPLKKGSIFFNEDALVPGPGGKVISKLGAVVDRAEFDKMLTEYYTLRGWDTATGLPLAATLRKFKLDDVAEDLQSRGLLG